jgi:hypothetical protein
MSWAARKRLKIVLVIGATAALILALALYLSIHTPPSCVDHAQNGGEAGVDCGGPCPYLCNAAEQAPVVRFTKVFPGLPGTTDVLAYVDNPNRDAFSYHAPYTLTLYSASSTVIGAQSGVVDLAPGATTPVFVANIPGAIARAYLAIDPAQVPWEAAKNLPQSPIAGSPALGGTQDAPRVSVALANGSAAARREVGVVAALFDASGNVVTASQTLVPEIPAQGSAEAVFTWNGAFPAAPVRIDIFPLPQLP